MFGKLLVVLALATIALGCNKTCADKVAEFDRIVESGGACTKDADCACFPGGIATKHSCGGVTDVGSNQKLESYARDFRTSGCTNSVQCAAWVCSPTCRDGRCSGQPRVGPASP
jgi:hypothetical protein